LIVNKRVREDRSDEHNINKVVQNKRNAQNAPAVAAATLMIPTLVPDRRSLFVAVAAAAMEIPLHLLAHAVGSSFVLCELDTVPYLLARLLNSCP